MTSITKLLLFSLLFISNVAFFVSGQVNIIDRCWRRHRNWSSNRQRLAMCSVGFAGKMTNNRGRDLKYYVVTDHRDDPVRPRRGTLRYGATIMRGKVWITFARNMNIKLLRPLIVSSLTVIDGRGAEVHITGGAGLLIQHANNVIIHGLHIHNIHPMPPGPTVGPGGKIQNVDSADGDAIRLVSSTKIWIDHNSLSQSQDGLIDVTRGSNRVTISNNWFFNHDKVMLLGHDDGYVRDKNMRVTVVFNRFGPNCVQRMPRVRHGYAHVANNFYDGWRDYAMGGSMNPTIKSQGNLFVAPTNTNKAIEWREAGNTVNVRSVGDAFLNGAHFRQLGRAGRPNYSRDQMFKAGRSSEVKQLTKDAGVLGCIVGRKC